MCLHLVVMDTILINWLAATISVYVAYVVGFP